MDLRLTLAVLVGKTIAAINRLTGSGATAAPGLYALKIDTNLIKKLSKKIKNGNIVISGTNGKTTTSRLTSNILTQKYNLVHNRQGSNLLRGIASTLIANSSVFANPRADLGLWEVDEATLPAALENLNPKTILLLNLFRDQLDRYGEVDTIRAKWLKSLEKVNKNTTLVLNADDPGIAYLGKNFKGKVLYFGVKDTKLNLPAVESVRDVRNCLNCGAKLQYSALLSSHMGHYKCPNCSFSRPNIQISASNLKFNPDFSTSIQITKDAKPWTLSYKLPGLFNVYNVLAATACAYAKGVKPPEIKKGVENFSAAFGRFQSLKIGDKNILIFLIKNPAGANEVLRTLSLKNNISLLTILNDKIADGHDVSWIWDTNWEILTEKVKNLAISGTRCWDMAARLKYANFNLSKNKVHEAINYSLKAALDELDKNNTLIILPTYTAMLELQKYITRGGSKWHQQ